MACSTCLCGLLEPDMALQGYLTKLDLGNLVSAGMLSVNVLFSNDIQVRLRLLSPSLIPGHHDWVWSFCNLFVFVTCKRLTVTQPI